MSIENTENTQTMAENERNGLARSHGVVLRACVNKSGVSVNVYSEMNGRGRIVGQIYNNEVFVLYGQEGSGISIGFANPSLSFIGGFLDGSINLPSNLFTPITDYPLRRLNNQFVFGLRRAATLRNPSGSIVTTLPSGTEVVCNSATVGQTYSNFKHITGVVNGNSINTNYAGHFVDMGFNHGSSGRTMTLYGTY